MLCRSLAEQQLRAGASHEAAAPPSGLTVSCGAVPFAPLTARAFRRKMAALPDPVPRPPRTDAVTQLTVAYSRLLRSSKDDAARDSASAVSRPLAQASASDASAHLRHTASDPALGAPPLHARVLQVARWLAHRSPAVTRSAVQETFEGAAASASCMHAAVAGRARGTSMPERSCAMQFTGPPARPSPRRRRLPLHSNAQRTHARAATCCRRACPPRRGARRPA